ncbi:MAG TPA: caspase family protein, partial [Roseiarcus sp.]|nr:caspase family protein [Roseiarcus sp.]
MNALFWRALRLICALVLSGIWAGDAFAGRRVALVVGNAKYEHADTLANPTNDAKAMADLFKRAGFDVVDERRDVGVVEFKRAVREFLSAAANADIAVVYYSGHGIEVGGVNYLIPVDAKLASAFDVDDETVSLDRVILASEQAKKLSLIILDACRENPFLRAEGQLPATRALTTRLIGVQPTNSDTLIAYAAKAGSLSYDGVGPNSPFTTALVKYIAEPGLDIRIALGKVRDDVLAATGNRQEPFVYGSLGGGDVSLVPAAPVASPAIVMDSSTTAALDYQAAERLGSIAAWRAYLADHGSGYYADLARAQLAKLSSGDAAKPSEIMISASKDAPGHVASSADAAHPPNKSDAPKLQQQAALEPGAAAPSGDQICERDEARLAKLRVNPTASEVAEFAQALGCESLRPQVKRLMESVGVAPVAPVAPAGVAPATPAPLSGEDRKQACLRAEGELQRLRASRSVEET